jgi:hypothetical protein
MAAGHQPSGMDKIKEAILSDDPDGLPDLVEQVIQGMIIPGNAKHYLIIDPPPQCNSTVSFFSIGPLLSYRFC